MDAMMKETQDKERVAKSRKLFEQGEKYRQLKQYNQAIKCFRKSLNIVTVQPSAYAGLAMCYLNVSKINKARAEFNYAFQFSKYTVRSPDLKYNYAIFHRETGNINEAISYFKDLLTVDQPFNILGFYELLQLGYNFKSRTIREMKRLLRDSETNRFFKQYIYYAFGDYYRKEQNYKQSWLNYFRGNSLAYNKPQRDSRIEMLSKIKDSMVSFFNKKTFPEGFLDRFNDLLDVENKKLIVIMGMPRSGTTLVENIISTDKKVFGMGNIDAIPQLLTQLEDGKMVYECIQQDPRLLLKTAQKFMSHIMKMAKCSDYVKDDGDSITIYLDKSASNTFFLGYIFLMFPKTKVINCERRFLDNAMSIYMTKYDEPEYSWTSNLGDIIKYQKINSELMAHWSSVFNTNNQFLNVKYEELVADSAAVSRQIIEFCGLKWHDKYLNFHRNKRVFLTKNSFKVREPIRDKYIGVWKPYEQYIGELVSHAGHMNIE